jgi:hypothetical protein
MRCQADGIPPRGADCDRRIAMLLALSSDSEAWLFNVMDLVVLLVE